MPTFEYQGQDQQGAPVRGLVFGASLDAAVRDLGARGLTVTQISQAASTGDPLGAPTEAPKATEARPGPTVQGPLPQRNVVDTNVWGPLVGQVPLTAMTHFFRQFGTMLHAGVPIVQSIDTLSKQTQSPKLRSVMQEVRGQVEQGRPMTESMQRYPEVFSPVTISLLRAGEQGGFMVDALNTIADYLDREIALRNMYRRVTFYPKLILGASIVIILAANAVISSMGKEGGLSSPLTQITTWFIIGPVLIGGFLFVRVGLANPRIRYNWDIFLTRVPYIGTTMKQFAMAKFGRAFGALYKGGVDIPKCLLLSADSCGNEYLRAKMYTAEHKISEGGSIGMTLRETGAFNPIVLDMIDTGETTGNLDLMLNKMAAFYEDEASTRATQTAQIFGVVVFLCVAIYVAFIVISFYTGAYMQTRSGE